MFLNLITKDIIFYSSLRAQYKGGSEDKIWKVGQTKDFTGIGLSAKTPGLSGCRRIGKIVGITVLTNPKSAPYRTLERRSYEFQERVGILIYGSGFGVSKIEV